MKATPSFWLLLRVRAIMIDRFRPALNRKHEKVWESGRVFIFFLTPKQKSVSDERLAAKRLIDTKGKEPYITSYERTVRVCMSKSTLRVRTSIVRVWHIWPPIPFLIPSKLATETQRLSSISWALQRWKKSQIILQISNQNLLITKPRVGIRPGL